MGDLLDLAVEKDIVAKTGAWFSYKEERLGQGRENAKQFLTDNPSVAASVEQEVMDVYGIGKSAAPSNESADSVASIEPKKNSESGGVQAVKAVKAGPAKAAASRTKGRRATAEG